MRRVDAAVALAVTEVEDEADQQPDDQSHPVGPAEAVNHRTAGDDAEDRDERCGRDPEPPFKLGISHAHDPDTGTNKNEGEQCADAGHFAGNIGGHERGERAGEKEKEYVRFPWRAITRMHFREDLRDEAVSAHGEEDAGLA